MLWFLNESLRMSTHYYCIRKLIRMYWQILKRDRADMNQEYVFGIESNRLFPEKEKDLASV